MAWVRLEPVGAQLKRVALVALVAQVPLDVLKVQEKGGLEAIWKSGDLPLESRQWLLVGTAGRPQR